MSDRTGIALSVFIFGGIGIVWLFPWFGVIYGLFWLAILVVGLYGAWQEGPGRKRR